MRLCELWVTIFCCGDEENGRCACTNGNSTTADQSEIRKYRKAEGSSPQDGSSRLAGGGWL